MLGTRQDKHARDGTGEPCRAPCRSPGTRRTPVGAQVPPAMPLGTATLAPTGWRILGVLPLHPKSTAPCAAVPRDCPQRARSWWHCAGATPHHAGERPLGALPSQRVLQGGCQRAKGARSSSRSWQHVEEGGRRGQAGKRGRGSDALLPGGNGRRLGTGDPRASGLSNGLLWSQGRLSRARRVRDEMLFTPQGTQSLCPGLPGTKLGPSLPPIGGRLCL